MVVHVVTGAARGIGEAVARTLHGSGELVVVDVDAEGLAAVAEELDAMAVVADISDAHDVARLVEASTARGDLGCLACVAGISPTMADGARVLDVDLRGTALVVDRFRDRCVTGSVTVCVASQAADLVAATPRPEIDAVLDAPLAADLAGRLRAVAPDVVADPGSAYGWAKRGVRRLVVAEAPGWAARGGRIVSVSPGIIATPQGLRELEQQPAMSWMIEQTPVGRMGEPEEIAAVVGFLASPAASFVTGVDWLVDGGSTHQVAAGIADFLGD